VRAYLIILETMAPTHKIEVLQSSSNSNEALKILAAHSDKWEESIVAGNCRVLMTTYLG
jgi:hypothetical protein